MSFRTHTLTQCGFTPCFQKQLFVHNVMPKLWTNKDVSDQELQNILPFLAHRVEICQRAKEKQLQKPFFHSAVTRQKILKNRKKDVGYFSALFLHSTFSATLGSYFLLKYYPNLCQLYFVRE